MTDRAAPNAVFLVYINIADHKSELIEAAVDRHTVRQRTDGYNAVLTRANAIGCGYLYARYCLRRSCVSASRAFFIIHSVLCYKPIRMVAAQLHLYSVSAVFRFNGHGMLSRTG